MCGHCILAHLYSSPALYHECVDGLGASWRRGQAVSCTEAPYDLSKCDWKQCASDCRHNHVLIYKQVWYVYVHTYVYGTVVLYACVRESVHVVFDWSYRAHLLYTEHTSSTETSSKGLCPSDHISYITIP